MSEKPISISTRFVKKLTRLPIFNSRTQISDSEADTDFKRARPMVSGHPVISRDSILSTTKVFRGRGKDLPWEDGFDLARKTVVRAKRPKPIGEDRWGRERVCGARLMVRRSMNPSSLPPPHSPQANPSSCPPASPRLISRISPSSSRAARPRSDDFVDCALDGGRARPTNSTGCPRTLDREWNSEVGRDEVCQAVRVLLNV